jgi:hypothetical protein
MGSTEYTLAIHLSTIKFPQKHLEKTHTCTYVYVPWYTYVHVYVRTQAAPLDESAHVPTHVRFIHISAVGHVRDFSYAIDMRA